MSFKRQEDVLANGGLCVNCRISRGQLVPAETFTRRANGPQVKLIYSGYARGIGRIFACDGTDIYISSTGFRFTKPGPSEGNSPFLIEDIKDGAPRAVLINGDYAMAHSGKSFTSFNTGTPLRCGAMHCGRLFGVALSDGYKLCWSGEGGADDWGEGFNSAGFLILDPERGEVSDILEYGEKLVLIRKLGITVLSMFGSPENFSVELTDTDTDEIYAKTARVAGGKLFFLAASGLCCYAGGTVTHINHGCGGITTPVCSAVLGSGYYLSCYSEKLASRAVFYYDAESGESCLINFAADAMCCSNLMFAYSTSGAYLLGAGGEYTFTGNPLDFGSGTEKTLTSLYVGGKADVEVSNGRVTRIFRGASGIIRPRLKGKSFTVKVSGSSAVTSLTAEAEVLNAI